MKSRERVIKAYDELIKIEIVKHIELYNTTAEIHNLFYNNGVCCLCIELPP